MFVRIVMNRKIYIAAVFLGLIGLSSCQKDEFDEVLNSSTQESLQITSDGKVLDKGDAVVGDSELEDSDITSSESDISPWEKEKIEISIKEVSDGDDEADGGDDSKTD